MAELQPVAKSSLPAANAAAPAFRRYRPDRPLPRTRKSLPAANLPAAEPGTPKLPVTLS